MNTYGYGFVFFLTLILLGMCRCRPGGTDEDLEAIRRLHQTDWAASKARDLETLRTLWTEDAVLLPPGGEPVAGGEAIWAFLNAQQPEMEPYEILEYRHDFQEIEILGDWAYEWGVFHGTYRRGGSEEIRKDRARLFRILKRQGDGSWKVSRAIWQELPPEEDAGP